MSLRLLCFADAHIFDRAGCDQALESLRHAVRAHRPDAIACLGDLFTCEPFLRENGAYFRREALQIHERWLFVAGNHDGSKDPQGRNELGWGTLCGTFGPAQGVHEINGVRVLTLGDCHDEAESAAFARREIRSGAVLLSHAPHSPEVLDQWAALGARLVLVGHRHALRQFWSRDGRCHQYNHAPFLFGGRSGDPAGYSIVDFIDGNISIRWVPQAFPAMPCNARLAAGPIPAHLAYPAGSGLRDTPFGWAECAPLQCGDETWVGGMRRLQYWRHGELLWEKTYGGSYQDVCSPVLIRHAGREHLVVSGTWVGSHKDGFRSVVVVDPRTGEERFRVPVIGLTAAPAFADGVLYLVGQWREIIAVEIDAGRERWRQQSEVETPATAGMAWRDGLVGGGWSVCQAAVGKHVWTVNARGDLFGYDRQTGRACFVHPAAIPLNTQPCCPFANRLACIAESFSRRVDPKGAVVFEVNGQGVEDESGRLVPANAIKKETEP